MSKYLEKVSNFRKVIKHNNGIVGSFLQLFRIDELKWGTLIGEDKFGNKYFENKYYFIGRSRWVEFSQAAGWDYDGSQIPAEWHRWMHYITDDSPVDKPPVKRKWMADHTENFSGTDKQYIPYSTTKPKIESWDPSKQ